jgi:bacteriocin biosynthesis cyclodehydratase domain-containing protein
MSPHIVVLHEGRFGAAVAQALGTLREVRPHPLVAARERLRALIAGADFVAVALWRRYEEECELLDAIAAETGVRWSLAVPIESALSCGPLVVPGHGACWRCYRRRALTHHRAPERELALAEGYRRDPALGPAGFTPPMVWTAAGALLADASAPPSAAGRLRRVNLLTGMVIDTVVIGVHGCDRCRAPSSGADPGRGGQPGERFLEHLVPALEELVP